MWSCVPIYLSKNTVSSNGSFCARPTYCIPYQHSYHSWKFNSGVLVILSTASAPPQRFVTSQLKGAANCWQEEGKHWPELGQRRKEHLNFFHIMILQSQKLRHSECPGKYDIILILYFNRLNSRSFLKSKEIIDYPYVSSKYNTPLNVPVHTEWIKYKVAIFFFQICVKQICCWLACHNRLIQQNNPDLLSAKHFSLKQTLKTCISHAEDR